MLDLVFENNTPHDIDLTLANKIAKDLDAGEIELIFTDNSEIHEINLTSRGVDKPTDVLSFPYEKMPHTPLGSIIISYEFVEKYAKELGCSVIKTFTTRSMGRWMDNYGFEQSYVEYRKGVA